MSKTYDTAMGFRIAGITTSVIAILLAVIRPFEPVLSVGIVYTLLILSTVLIIIGQLIVIRLVPEEEFKNPLQRKEALYDVITTGAVVLIFIIIYVVPFVFKYIV
jgi:hypothetical protein